MSIAAPADRFAPFADKMRAAGMPDIAVDCFRYYFERYLRGDTGTVPDVNGGLHVG